MCQDKKTLHDVSRDLDCLINAKFNPNPDTSRGQLYGTTVKSIRSIPNEYTMKIGDELLVETGNGYALAIVVENDSMNVMAESQTMIHYLSPSNDERLSWVCITSAQKPQA